jgi:hypothetical protein
MKNHRTLVTPPARGRRLRCTVSLCGRGGATGIGTSPARSHLTTRSRSPFPGGSLGTFRARASRSR